MITDVRLGTAAKSVAPKGCCEYVGDSFFFWCCIEDLGKDKRALIVLHVSPLYG